MFIWQMLYSGMRCVSRLQRISVLLSVVVLLGTALTSSAAFDSDQPDFLIHTWDRGDGLPSARIEDITRTPDGYLWIATAAGLVRFDGSRFLIFTTSNTPALQDNRTSCLLVDSTGDLWIGTLRGTLTRMHQGKFVPVSLPSKVQGKKPLNSLAQGADGAVWGATGAGLLRLHNGVSEIFGPSDGLPNKWVWRVVIDANGVVWAIAGGKLGTFDGHRWKTQAIPGWENMTAHVQTLARSSDGGIWVATIFGRFALQGHGGQIIKCKNGVWNSALPPFPWPYGTKSPKVTSLMEDATGRIWVGTYNAGLLYFDVDADKEWHRLESKSASGLSIVNCLAGDDSGLVWVGYDRSHGLQQVRRRPVKMMHLPDSAGRSVVFTACAARDGSIWIGTSDARVFRYRDGQFEHYGTNQGILSPHIGTILEGSHTNLWVGTWGGLYELQGKRFERVKGPKELQSRILSLCEDHQGNLWVGGSEVLCLGAKGAKVFGPEEGFLGHNFGGIAADRDGNVWVASANYGLFHNTGGRFDRYGTTRWAGETKIQCLYVDESDALWIATWGGGLYRLKDGNLRHWSTADGLPSGMLHSIIEDMAGNLWLNSDNGFFGCPKREFDDYISGKSLPLLFWRLTIADGLDSPMGSGVGTPAVTRSADGRLWFPNQSALAVFDPATFYHLKPVRPSIEQVLVDGVVRSPQPGDTLRIQSSSRNIEFHFTAPNLAAPGQERFLFQLKGWDDNWVKADNQRMAHYRRLAPGRYQFEVLASGGDCRWQAAVSALTLEVVPPFWEKRWVQALGLMVLLGVASSGGWWLKRRGEHRARALEQERRRIARDLHDDLGSRLTEVMMISEAVESAVDQRPDLRYLAGQMFSKTCQSIRAIDEIVWTVNPENDTLANFIGYVSDYAQELLSLAEISCRLDVPPNLPQMEIAAPVRHNLFLTVKEALNNAVKHSGASEICLQVTCSTEELCLVIQDNGKGFKLDETENFGNGLENLRQRLEAVGGIVELFSVHDQGTQTRLLCPLRCLGSARR